MRLLVWMLLCSALAQAQPPAPSPSLARPFRIAGLTETRLSNGLDVILIDDTRAPLVSARLVFACGNRRDPKNMPGLASAVADLLPQATKKRSLKQMVELLDGLGGGSVGAASGADQITIGGSIEADGAAALLDVMADLARNALFQEVDVKLYRQNRRQLLARQRSQPSFVANEEFRRALFGDHPYGHIGPTLASIELLDRQALIDYRDTWMVPNNAVLVVMGKLPSRAETMKTITGLFETWEKKPLPEVKPEPLPKAERKLLLVDVPGLAQAEVKLGKIAATQRDAAYLPELLASTMGTIRMEHVAFDEAGIVSFGTQVPNESAGDALQPLLDRLDRMGKVPVPEKELADGKSQTMGNFVLRLEPQAGLLEELTIDRLQKLPADYVEKWVSRLEAVQAGDVQAAAKRFMSTQDMAIVVVGDAAKLAPSLEKIGKFEVVKAGR